MVLDTFLIVYVGVLVSVTQHTQKITCKKYKLHKTLGDRNLNFGKYLLCKAKKKHIQSVPFNMVFSLLSKESIRTRLL